MRWYVGIGFSIAFVITTIVIFIVKCRNNPRRLKKIDGNKILSVGLGASAVSLLFPIYLTVLDKEGFWGIEAFFVSVHSMLRLFLVDGDFQFLVNNVPGDSFFVLKFYSVAFSLFYVLAPVFSVGFVLSFFKNISAYKSYIFHAKMDVYIFSEMNDRSLAFAESVYESDDKSDEALLVFTDVFSQNNEHSFEMIEKAKSMGAILFKNDIATVNFNFHSNKSKLHFLFIGDNHTENLNQAFKIIGKYKCRANTYAYVFTYQPEAELLLARTFKDDYGNEDPSVKIEIRCINDVQSLIYHNLYTNGYENIFKSSYEDDCGVKNINAVVVGLGQHGTEMTKALSWFGQMCGYKLKIDSFDIKYNAKKLFVSECPKLMDERFNGNFSVLDDAQYKITIHSGFDVETSCFDDALYSLEHPTYFFICLGDDEKNIAVAMKIRTLMERLNFKPVIQAVVYNGEKNEFLNKMENHNGDPYKIDFMGGLNNSYSKETMLNSTLYELAKIKHCNKDYPLKDFVRYSYSSKSTIASVIHDKMKKLCNIPGANVEINERTVTEKLIYRINEHNRWNAYMRSEGYGYSGTTEKSSRNFLAKTHHLIVPYHELPPEEQMKDD